MTSGLETKYAYSGFVCIFNLAKLNQQWLCDKSEFDDLKYKIKSNYHSKMREQILVFLHSATCTISVYSLCIFCTFLFNIQLQHVTYMP